VIKQNSTATSTNIRFGSAKFADLWWNVTDSEIPDISIPEMKLNSRSGALTNQAADTVDYGELQINILIDRDWSVFASVYDSFVRSVNVKDSTYTRDEAFDLWVETVNGEGKAVGRFWFYNCRLSNFGGAVVTPNDESDATQTLSIGFNILYYEYEDLNEPKKLS